ncbi:MAG TPA: nucleoside triphosphate pyrophosphohydrolase [bacterium]|nr:nucleoside triphosphate pyrophosphohydrolase [bacterium]HPS29034.1 nucleoside triphosphate pyrophosphohydrolase [bacterium]
MADNKGISKLIEIMALLRSPNGCPWDREQTLTSLRPYVIEEAFETVEALDSLDTSDSASVLELQKELGDLLLQVVFISQMAREQNLFEFDDVADIIAEKLIMRHPHVFGDSKVADSAEVLTNWNLIKKKKENRKYLLDGIPKAMPAVNLSQRYASRAASVGFDWEKWSDVIDKIDEEKQELIEAVEHNDIKEIEHELGDMLFAVVNLGRKLGVDSEKALKLCAERFKNRFDRMEELDPAFIDGKKPLDELEALWQKAKKELNDR